MTRSRCLLPCLGLLLAGASARGGTLTNATWLQVTDTGLLGAPFALPMTRTTAQLGAAGTSTANSIAVSLSYPAFSTSFIVLKTVNAPFFVDLAIKITQGGPQAITATPGMGNGAPGVPGTVIVMTAAHGAMGVNQSMFKVGINTIVEVPLSIGRTAKVQLGRPTTPSGEPGGWTVVGAAHSGTVSFFAWTPGTLVFSGLTTKGKALPSVIAMGSFNLTAKGGGTVTLVAPSKISIDGSIAQRRTASFSTLLLSFVPEPGALLLVTGGALGLALIGLRRPR